MVIGAQSNMGNIASFGSGLMILGADQPDSALLSPEILSYET